MLDDVRRFRDGMPVLTRVNRAGYRLRKFGGRHRGALAVAAALVLLLAAGFTRERVLRARAEAEARKAKAIEEYFVSIFNDAEPFSVATRPGQELTARALLDRGAQRAKGELAGSARTRRPPRRRCTILRRCLEMRSQFGQAEIFYRRALAAKRLTLGNAHPSVTVNLNNLGIMLAREMERGGAEKRDLVRRCADELRELLLGPSHLADPRVPIHPAFIPRIQIPFGGGASRDGLRRLRASVHGESATAESCRSA